MIPAVHDDAPWNSSLQDRLRTLHAGKRRVAYVHESPHPGTFMYRAYNMAQALNGLGGDVSAACFSVAELAHLPQIEAVADAAVLCRMPFSPSVQALVSRLRLRGKRVIFDIDDLLFEQRYVDPALAWPDGSEGGEPACDRLFAHIGRLGATLRLCDAVITTNELLAQCVRGFAEVQVAQVPDFLNQEQWAVSQTVLAARQSRNRSAGDPICLGHFAGPHCDAADFAMVVPALAELMANDDRIHLLTTLPRTADLEALGRLGSRVRHVPAPGFMHLQGLIGSVDLNLMPLRQTALNECRSEIRCFEAAVVGTPSIASPTYTLSRVIDHGTNGYLAAEHEWLEVIRHAIAQIGSHAGMAAAAAGTARQARCGSALREAIVAALALDAPALPRSHHSASVPVARHLREIHAAKLGKVSDKWKSYLDYYHGLLEPMRGNPLTVLEIGVQNGGSLETWSEFFPQARAIIGCDIDPNCGHLRFADPRIHVVVGDAGTAATRDHIAALQPQFDLVIDDGSHKSHDILAAFALYFPLLKAGGLYCIEDTCTLYWQEYGGGLTAQHNASFFFKALADVVNREHWRDAPPIEEVLAPFFPGGSVPASVCEGWVDSVYFRNSMIVVAKSLQPGHAKIGRREIAGEHALVNAAPLALRAAAAGAEG